MDGHSYWQNLDRKTLKESISGLKTFNGILFQVLGNQKRKYDYPGAWSRRIDAENRLIYMVDGKSVA